MNNPMVMEDQKQGDLEDLVVRYVESRRPELKDLIMVKYTGLVERVARRYAGIEPVADLVQVGFVGLLNALNRFDPASGVRFTTYAQHLVVGEIKHYLRDRSQAIRQPAWLQELRHKVNRAAGKLASSGRQATPEEIARELGVPESAVCEVFTTQETLRVASLDARTDDEGGDSGPLECADPSPETVRLEDRLVLESAIGQLRDLERQVLISFHFESMRQAEIAEKLSISPNYVSHILRQSLTKLRRILEEEEAQEERRRGDTFAPEVIERATGAYAETYTRTRLKEEIHRARATGDEVGLLLVELDGCSRLHRSHGPDSVTRLLTEVCEMLRANVRRLDLVGRFGTTGFALVLPHAGPNVAVVRERLALRLASWLVARAHLEGLDFYCGDAWWPKHGDTPEQIIDAAALQVRGSRAAGV